MGSEVYGRITGLDIVGSTDVSLRFSHSKRTTDVLRCSTPAQPFESTRLGTERLFLPGSVSRDC